MGEQPQTQQDDSPQEWEYVAPSVEVVRTTLAFKDFKDENTPELPQRIVEDLLANGWRLWKDRAERFKAALKAIRGPADEHEPFIGAYIAAGGGYEGLQAIARKALRGA